MAKKRKRSYRREVILETIRRVERVCAGLWDICGNEVRCEEDKLRISAFRRGAQYAINETRKAL
jgi:hypothetical protein